MTYPYGPPPQGQAPGAYQGPGAPPPVPEGLQLSNHVGDLIWIKVGGYDPAYVFPFGTKSAVQVDLEVIVGRSEVGDRQTGAWLSNVLLVKQLSGEVGREMFGRVAEQPGKNANGAIYLGPPWPGDEAAVHQFLARNGGGQQQPPQQPQAQQAQNAQGGGYGQQAPQGYPAQGQAPYGGPQGQQQPNGGQPYAPPQQPQAQPAGVGAGMPPAAPPPGFGQGGQYAAPPQLPNEPPF